MSSKSNDDWGYPRPLLRRSQWVCLNGEWDFSLDATAAWQQPGDVRWDRTIRVPFSPETTASGVHEKGFFRACWYRREFEVPPLAQGQRLRLHFGAVDYRATVWVDTSMVVANEGGYIPFEADITQHVRDRSAVTITVRAEDEPGDLAKPRGKQEWQSEPHSIWYPRTSGIWQTVWYEVVEATYLSSLHWTPNVERWEIGLEAHIEGVREGLRLEVDLRARGRELISDSYSIAADEVHRALRLSDPGIDDYRNELLWSPSEPTLIEAELRLMDQDRKLLDQVFSYTALRSFSIQGDRFVLNGRPLPLYLVLDQGYWPDGGLSGPSDIAFRKDVELAKAMGFNGVRKHQKIENPRYLYWADQLGLLVWEEMPSAYRFTRVSVQRLAQEWHEIIFRDRSHPCIMAWVPFNESWGVPDLPDSPTQRHYVQALYHLTKTLDPTRPVIGNDGWESVATDIIGIHDYDNNPERLAVRYGMHNPRLFQFERPGGRQLLIGSPHQGQPVMLTEFGGIAYSTDRESTWGYSRSETPEEFANKYAKLWQAVRRAPMLAGICYTQFADTYQECNGLLYADRTPKIPLEMIALATRGSRSTRDPLDEFYWREQLMRSLLNVYAVPDEDRSTRAEPRP